MHGNLKEKERKIAKSEDYNVGKKKNDGFPIERKRRVFSLVDFGNDPSRKRYLLNFKSKVCKSVRVF